MNTLYNQLLLFPDRAENLGQFSAYDVDLEHWKSLSAVFRQTFQSVYERGSSSILLVHGAQGTGKTLFSRRLEQDFKKATEGSLTPDSKNLWHTLVGDDPPKRATIETATQGSLLSRVEPASAWLQRLRETAKLDTHRVRIFVIDDAHKDVFLREWAGLTQAEYLGFKAQKQEGVALSSVAERLVEDCRGDFLRTIFLLLSNDADRMKQLKEQVDLSHAGLAKVLELPLPPPEMKEQIVRKNTNRLNRMSYWYCLDAAGKDERLSVYDVLKAPDKGFTNSFIAVSEALRSADVKRSGRPANRNVITLVTLGTTPSTAKGFIDDHELSAQEHHCGDHLGIWYMREQWASTLCEGDDREMSRRAQMLESEFALQWFALDMVATFELCRDAQQGDIGGRLLDLIRFVPSIAKPADAKKRADACASLERELITGQAEQDAFQKEFRELGQRRSTLYEPAIGRRLGGYSRGFMEFPSVKPDFIAGEYKPCSVTDAAARGNAEITEAIRRSCHAIEFTAHLQDDMNGSVKAGFMSATSFNPLPGSHFASLVRPGSLDD
jgi:hypothetical protein